MPCPEALGYTQGKTLGSGTYAKVRAAWSPFEKKMVRNMILYYTDGSQRGQGWGWVSHAYIITIV